MQAMISETLIPMEEVLELMMDKYLSLNKRRRKEINKILKEIKKSKQNEVKNNGAIA
jgi:CRISPR/Cas system-associated exonuclease Cas4 (RecB family)